MSVLSPKRQEHSKAVAKVAKKMAENYGVDSEKAYITALLHDYAKGIPAKELLKIAEENNLIEDEIERMLPDLLHATVGAYLLRKEWGIDDSDILQAISYHTLANTEMSKLDKIIYIADMIEPGRDYPGLQRLQCLAFQSLDQSILFALETTIRYCIDKKRIIHPRSVLARNHYLSINKDEEEL